MERIETRIAAGDPAAFEEAIVAARKSTMSVAANKLAYNGVTDPEDVYQQTTLQAWKAVQRGAYHDDGCTPFSGYLAIIARNICVSLIRKGGKSRSQAVVVELDPEFDEVYHEQTAASDANIANLDVIDILNRVLPLLRPADQKVLYLRYIDGLDYDEIARYYNGRYTVDALRIVVSRALKKARGFVNVAE